MQRAPLDPLGAAAGEKGAQVARRAIHEVGDRGRRAKTLGQKGEELSGVAAVGLDRVGGQLSFVRERAKPRPDDRGEVGRSGQDVRIGWVEGRRHVGQDRPKTLKVYGSSDVEVAPSAARVKARA